MVVNQVLDMPETLNLSQEILGPDTFNAVVQELGNDGGELLAAVESDANIFRTEPLEYNEDQKHFLAWTPNGNQYEPQNYDQHQQQLMYAQSVNPQVPPQIPANVDYAGDLDFDIIINTQTNHRNSWIYSQQLKKVFINMHNILPVDVKRNSSNMDLYLRATMLYSLPQFAQELVERCSTHVDARIGTNRDMDPQVIKHVLRCTNPGSFYCGQPHLKEHLSVVTPLCQPQAGMETVRINYQFMCKNSCPSGMNRRAVDVIFTLEDHCGLVLGRRKLSVRVCSCPKRDKEKEEKEYKDEISQIPGARKRIMKRVSRKREREHTPPGVDEDVYEIPSFKVIGRQTAEIGLRIIRDRLFINVCDGNLSEEKQDEARDCIKDIDAIINTLSPK